MTDDRRGFALLEVVVILAIFAVVAAFAVPRIVTLRVEARSAEVTALAGSLRTSVARSHSIWLRGGQPETVTMDGRVIAMTNGYPSERSIGDTVSSLDGFVYDPSRSPGVFSVAASESKGTGPCRVSYTAAPMLGAPPEISEDASGC